MIQFFVKTQTDEISTNTKDKQKMAKKDNEHFYIFICPLKSKNCS